LQLVRIGGEIRWNFWLPVVVCQTRNYAQEVIVKNYLTRLSPTVWMLVVVPAIVLVYPVATIVVSAVIHAVVPEVVRTVLTVL
jgi:hypothetical protein